MAILGIIGWLILVAGIIWMVVTAIQTGQTTGEKALWGIVCLICGVLGGIIFFAVKRQGLIPLILEIVGVILYVRRRWYGVLFGRHAHYALNGA